MDNTSKVELIESETDNLKKEILFDGWFYDVTEFIHKHPGGSVIEYFTEKGEDGTLAIQQFHKRTIDRVTLLLRSLKKRPATDDEIHLDAHVLKKNRSLTEDFTKLFIEVEKKGYFKPSLWHVFFRLTELFVLAGIGFALVLCQRSIFYQLIGYLIITLAQSRANFLTHELGHYSCSGSPKADRFIDSVVSGVFTGRSAARWKRQHFRHHAMPQRVNHDVDLDTMPLLAYNTKCVKESQNGKGFMIKYQAYLYVIDTLLVGILWKFYREPRFVIKGKRYLDMVTIILHHVIFYQLGFWPMLLTTWAMLFHLFTTFAMNHTFLPVATEPTHWVEYSLLHTANVSHAPWADWATGYLNYQIEHHLFPTMPNFRLHLVKDKVKALARKHNLPYTLHSVSDALTKVFKNMSDVADELSRAKYD